MNSEQWSVLEIVLGTPLLARVCGPFDDGRDADRLSYLLDLIARLRRSYDPVGIQERFVTSSGGAAPVDVLQGDWDPAGKPAQRLLRSLPAVRG